MPGTKGHEFEDMRQFADWRCDYVKIDWCNTEGQNVVKAYTLLHDAQHAAGRPIVHSLCSWGEGSPWKWATAVGHLWRTTDDICEPGGADWDNVMKITFANETLFQWAGPGHWNDPDMLVIGKIGWGPDVRATQLTPNEQITHITLWCLLAAPLLLGCDLSQLDPFTLALLTNDEVIGVDQDPLGKQASRKARTPRTEVWAKPMSDGTLAVGLFNRAPIQGEVIAKWSDLGIQGQQPVRDLWLQKDLEPAEGSFTAPVPGHGAMLLRIGRPRTPAR
jgi:alpha-galactosidase